MSKLSQVQYQLNIAPRVKIKETYEYLANFKRFSLIEKIEPRFFKTSTEASVQVADIIRKAIEAKNKKGEIFVIGLATGSTPLKVYKELIRLHKQQNLSFKKVVSFNLDEYFPIMKSDPQSYNYYMRTNLFDHIDIPSENINVPDGEIPRNQVTKYCQDYEKKIQSYGGIDIQILGIGRTGHIGFNEPPSPINSGTRLVYLHRLTRFDASTAFGGEQNVPKCAITMGINTIKRAKKILIMAWSENKAEIVKRSIQGDASNQIPSTFLHTHPDATFFLDKAAGEKLERFTHPWTIKGDTEDPIVPKSQYWILNSVIWLSMKVKKPVLSLQFEDYQDNNLADLVTECAFGRYQDLNIYVHKKMKKKITSWPLGNKPMGLPQDAIAKTTITPKKVIVFSPHPDDDVISMGGTIRKLVQQGNKVYVAYMTSGANGVFDYDAQKYFYFLKDVMNSKMFDGQNSSEFLKFYDIFAQQTACSEEFFNNPFPNQQKQISKTFANFTTVIKKFIRSSEAKIALKDLGVNSESVYDLDLPFYYERPRIPGQADYKKVLSFLRLIEPDFIYAAGDLSDPHGTHRHCLQIIKHLFDEEQVKKQEKDYEPIFPPAQNILLYRGAWEEWPAAMAKHVVPMSPKDVEIKTLSILKHQSQKDNPMFPGDDRREFWERVKIRNKNTAKTLKLIGLTEYEAAQAFVDLIDLIDYDEL